MEDRRGDCIQAENVADWKGLEALDQKFWKEVRLFTMHMGMFFFVMFDRRTLVMGESECGKLGLGAEEKKAKTPTELIELRGKALKKIVGGTWTMTALDADGKVWTWGQNAWGLMGIGKRSDKKIYKPVEVNFGGAKKIVDVKANDRHTLALDEDGKVWAWGHNDCGQTGIGTKKYIDTPTQISTLESIVQIECAIDTSYGLNNGGKVFGWGAGAGHTPTPIGIDGHVEKIITSERSTLFLTRNGRLYHDFYKDDSDDDVPLCEPCAENTPKFLSIISNNSGLFSARDDQGNVLLLFPKWKLKEFEIPDNLLSSSEHISLNENLLQLSTTFEHELEIFRLLLSSTSSLFSLSFMIFLNSSLDDFQECVDPLNCPPPLSLYFDHQPSSNFTFDLLDGPSLHVHQYHLSALNPHLSHLFSTLWSNSVSASLTKLPASTYRAYFACLLYLYIGDTPQFNLDDFIKLTLEFKDANLISKYFHLPDNEALFSLVKDINFDIVALYRFFKSNNLEDLKNKAEQVIKQDYPVYSPPNSRPLPEYSFEAYNPSLKASLQSVLTDWQYLQEIKSKPGNYIEGLVDMSKIFYI